jgi:hypothetical protein
MAATRPAVPQPAAKSVSQIKSALLRPALTSHYELYLSTPNGNAGDFNNLLKTNLNTDFSAIQPNLHLACCEATLPGSNLATIEINSDYTGVTERHAYRRVYDDRIDLTFYVDANYTVIRFFEFWIKYIVSESISGRTDAQGTPNGPVGLTLPNYFYSVRYPKEYQSKFSITKFERDYSSKLIYTFLNAYPISISSMPISYESSSLLKCSVSFSYSRYYIENLNGSPPPQDNSSQSTLGTPLQQAQFNTTNYQSFVNPEFGVLNTTGGIFPDSALASGNSIQVFEGDEIIGAVNANASPVESGLPYVGRNVGPLAP